MEDRHLTINAAHAKTCQWLFERTEYKDWLDNAKREQHDDFLWIKGKPGAGKSTLMKCALPHASRNMKDRTILSFFFPARGSALETLRDILEAETWHTARGRLDTLSDALGSLASDPVTDLGYCLRG